MSSNVANREFAHFVDPFGASADPARYVARMATERALELLEEAVRGRRSVLLYGTPGIGKTLLLRVLAARLAPEVRALHMPYPSLPATALGAWALELLGRPASYDPLGALVGYARRPDAGGEGLVLLLDDADSMPEDTARHLAEAARESEGKLRIAAAADRAGVDAWCAVFRDAECVSLLEPMSPEETTAYVAAHLAAATLPAATRAAFDDACLTGIQERTAGLPARVSAEASATLRRVVGQPDAAEPPALEVDELEVSEFEASELLDSAELVADDFASAGPAMDELETAEPGSEELESTWSDLPVPDTDEPVALEPVAPELEVPELEVPEPEVPELEIPEPEVPELEAEEGETGFERAARLLALSHGQPGASTLPADAKFERVESPAKLAHPEPVTAVAPPPAADSTTVRGVERAPRAPVRPPPARRARSVRRRAAFAVLGCFFALGAGVGIWMANPSGEPASEAPAAVAPAPAPPAPVAEVPVPAAPPPAPAEVQINATPWARIRVDGRDLGYTPLAGVLLEPGAHVFEAEMPDGSRIERVVEVDAVNRFIVFP